MPYIKQEHRDRLNETLSPETPGDLNYLITELIKEYIENKKMSYSTCNDVIGALECCKIEFYRRVVSVWEDDKIQKNGDVY